MSDSPPSAAAEVQGLDLELANLAADDERERFFSLHSDQVNAATVKRVCRRATTLLRMDLEQAGRLAHTACWLADQLLDSTSMGLSRRLQGNVLLFRRDYRGALAEYDVALENFERVENVMEAALTRNAIVGGLSYLGDYERAFQEATLARATFEEKADHRHLGMLENNLGLMMSRRDRFHEALKHLESACEHYQSESSPSLSNIGIALRNIAVCHQDLNDMSAALEAYERARAFCAENNLPLVALEVGYNIAYLHYLGGEYTEALELFEAARRSCEELEDPHHLALCDLDQAEIFLELNLVEEAARLGRKAYEGFTELGMHYETAKALSFQAVAARRLGEPQQALDLLGQAREIFEQQENRVWAAHTDLHCSLVFFENGQSVKAAGLAAAALEAFSDSGLPAKIALCEMVLARICLEQGDTVRASELCSAAFEKLERIGMPAFEFQAHYLSGRIEEASGNRAPALAAYRRSHETLEGLRSHLRTEEISISFLADKQSLYKNLVALTLEGGAEAADLEAAFGYMEAAKSRSLADLLAFRAQALPATTPGAENTVRAIRTLREELNLFHHRIQLEEMKGEARSLERLDGLRESGRRHEKRLVRALRSLQTADPEYCSLQESVTADLETVRAVLPRESTLLEYFIARDLIYACVIDRERMIIRPVAPAAEVQKLHRFLGFELSKLRRGSEYSEGRAELGHRATLSYLSKLYEGLIAPIRGELRGGRLIVVPHDFLHHLPMHALYDGERFLSDHFVISYAPSATVLSLCSRRNGHTDDSALVMGVADEGAPLILDEVKAVAEVVRNSTLLTGEAATRQSLQRLGKHCRIVHIASHGFHRQDNPMFSAIQLGDGRLALFDLYDLKLNAELVVLSGCSTGLGVLQGADEHVGLTRGLLYAGARSVLVTLWDVNDESTSGFMRSFYRHLAADPEPVEALGKAVKELREEYPHPYHWAPFVLIGPPGATEPSPGAKRGLTLDPTTVIPEENRPRPISELGVEHSLVIEPLKNRREAIRR